MDDGEFRAEALTEVTSVADGDAEEMETTVNASGKLVARRTVDP